jgi:hypothetical protein
MKKVWVKKYRSYLQKNKYVTMVLLLFITEHLIDKTNIWMQKI